MECMVCIQLATFRLAVTVGGISNSKSFSISWEAKTIVTPKVGDVPPEVSINSGITTRTFTKFILVNIFTLISTAVIRKTNFFPDQ